ncbi:MAG TPA: ABC transporter ATP-binding protein [Bacilli bacterium]
MAYDAEKSENSYSVSPENRRKAFRALLSYAAPHRKLFLIIVLCSLLAISADLLQPYLVKIAIDGDLLTGENSAETLLLLGLTYFVLAAVSMLFTYLQANLLQKAGQSIVAQLRKDLFRHIASLSMSFFDRHHIGSLVTNESSDTETISQFFTQVLLSLVRDGLYLVLIILFMFHLDAELAMYCMAVLPVIAIIAVIFRTFLRRYYQQARAQLSRLIAFIAENLAGMSIIQSFHQEQEQHARFTKQNEKYYAANLQEVRTSILFNRSFDILGNVAVALLVWIGGLAVLGQKLEFGVLYAFISYIRQFFQPINQITQQWNTMQSTLVSMDRIWRIFATEQEVTDPAPEQQRRLQVAEMQGRVDFNRIRFAYGDGVEVLHDLDLHINGGEFIGIVGETGAGKSSLISLLARFYDVTAGSIEIDGVDIRRIPQHALHQIVGLVQQEPFLFSGTIIDNVRLFDQSISREQVMAACKLVGAHGMISRLAHGYDTRLSERGSGLSAGERQLLSFARIVVFQPKILILDEATANLDSHTEQLIQAALQKVAQGRTTLVIAHRLSTIMQADRIIVMREGRIVEAGNHRQLLKRGGIYADMVRHSHGEPMRESGSR